MAESSSPEITPKEEPVNLDKPESPNPFLPVSQVEFTFDEITFTTNNEVALLYPSHPNQDYFEAVSDFISKYYLKEAFIRAPNQYKEYLREVWYTSKTLDDSKVWISSPTGGVREEIGIITFRNALRAQYLPHSKHMIPEYENEELIINPTQVFSVHNLTLKPNQPEEPPFTDHIKSFCNLDVLVDSKAPKPSSKTEEVPQGKKPRAKSGLRRKRSSKHTSESKTEKFNVFSSVLTGLAVVSDTRPDLINTAFGTMFLLGLE
ncbi:hypothetical protein Tco_1440513 [Tanacetum coccineum]